MAARLKADWKHSLAKTSYVGRKKGSRSESQGAIDFGYNSGEGSTTRTLFFYPDIRGRGERSRSSKGCSEAADTYDRMGGGAGSGQKESTNDQ